MIDIILHQPEIPQNTGNIGRLCAFSDCRLHLIHPLGFEINDRNLRRAGMDYWSDLDVIEHNNWDNFIEHPLRPSRVHLLTTHAKQSIWDVKFEKVTACYSEMKGMELQTLFTNGSTLDYRYPNITTN
jgi:tRNA (cytidine/uridine-2'-O-)-methyltransferase